MKITSTTGRTADLGQNLSNYGKSITFAAC